jgi:mannose-6-phosphate isomerase-like protein (cupin superfamily)
MNKSAITSIAVLLLVAPLAVAQAQQPTGRAPAAPQQSGNDPNYNHGKGGGINSFPSPAAIVYSPRETEDRRIDLYMADWHESMPRSLYGSLVVRDIMTHGDYFSPPQKGAVLPAENFIAHATLSPHWATTPTTLQNEQVVMYFIGGKGTLSAGGAVAQLHKDYAVFIPANLEFVIKNTTDEPLELYLISEPTYPGFKPIDKMLAIDESQAHVRSPAGPDPYIVPGASGHWGHRVREIFAKRDGLATLSSILTVELSPMSLGEPHPHGVGAEEVWTALEGDSLAWMGSQIRLQKPGMAYMIRPDTFSTHSNINFGNTMIKFLYFNGRRHVPQD